MNTRIPDKRSGLVRIAYILEHSLEMVHAYQPTLVSFPLHDRIKYPTYSQADRRFESVVD